MFKVPFDQATKVAANEKLWAVRCAAGKILLAGSNFTMEVPGEDIRLGEVFIATATNVIMRESEHRDFMMTVTADKQTNITHQRPAYGASIRMPSRRKR